MRIVVLRMGSLSRRRRNKIKELWVFVVSLDLQGFDLVD